MTSDAKTQKASLPLLEYGLLLLLALLWGSSFSFLKLSVATIPPITAAAGRALLAGLLLYAIMRWQGQRLPLDRSTLKSLAALALVNTLLPYILITWGIKGVDASLAVILNSTTPIFAFLITWGLTRQEPVTARKAFGIATGLAGIIMIVGSAALSGLGTELIPQLSIVCGSIAYATSAIYGRSFRHMGPFVPAAGSLLLASIVLIPMALIVEQPWTVSPSATSVTALIIVGLFGTALGNVLYFRLLGSIGSIATTSQAYLRVPIGVLVSMLLLGETLSTSGAAGLVLVVIGVAAMTIPRGTRIPAGWLGRGHAGSGQTLAAQSPRYTEYALLLLLAVLWAGSFVWVKIGLETIPPLTLMLGRISIAALALLVIVKMRGLRLPRDADVWKRSALQGILTTVIPFSLVAWGQQWVDAGVAAILNSLAPVFAFLVTWSVTRHESASALRLFGIVAGLSGVALVIGPSAWGGIGRELIPQLAIVAASLSYGLGAINSRHFRGADPAVSATSALLCATAIMLPLALLVERPWNIVPSTSSLTAMIGIGLFSTALGFLIYFRLSRTLGPILLSSQSYLRAPIGVLLGAVILGEAVTGWMLGGMAMVVVGVAAMSLPARAERRTTEETGRSP